MRVDKNYLWTVIVCFFLMVILALILGARAGATAAAVTEPPTAQPLVCVVRFTPEQTSDAKPKREDPVMEDPAEEASTTPSPLEQYTPEDLMCIANMLYGEITAITYDSRYTEDEQNLVLQEWACIPLNHIAMGIADTLPDLMRTKTSAGYYVWHPRYATEDYMNRAVAENPDLYERCRINALIAMSDQMQCPVPGNVIYADAARHGREVYKQYDIDTGWFRATAYLCYG